MIAIHVHMHDLQCTVIFLTLLMFILVRVYGTRISCIALIVSNIPTTERILHDGKRYVKRLTILKSIFVRIRKNIIPNALTVKE